MRMFYDFLIEEGVRGSNPVGRGRYTCSAVRRRLPVAGVLDVELPWIPAESEWTRLLHAFGREPIRNRLMLPAQRRVAAQGTLLVAPDDFDPAHRTLRVRAETTKTRRERIVPSSVSTGVLLGMYLRHVRRARGPLFLSESRRNVAEP